LTSPVGIPVRQIATARRHPRPPTRRHVVISSSLVRVRRRNPPATTLACRCLWKPVAGRSSSPPATAQLADRSHQLSTTQPDKPYPASRADTHPWHTVP